MKKLLGCLWYMQIACQIYARWFKFSASFLFSLISNSYKYKRICVHSRSVRFESRCGQAGFININRIPPFFENLLLLKHFLMMGKVQNFEPATTLIWKYYHNLLKSMLIFGLWF